MRLSNATHSARPWRIHEIASDFVVEDVWDLPTPGGPDDLDRLVQQFAHVREEGQLSAVVTRLMRLRWALGGLVGWDKPGAGLGTRVPSLCERLPVDLADAPRPDMHGFLFTSVYQTHDEWVGEYADKVLQAVMHLGWVPDASGDGYHARMAVLIKSEGWLGRAYMAAIRPFRLFLVYPSMLRSVRRRWEKQPVG